MAQFVWIGGISGALLYACLLTVIAIAWYRLKANSNLQTTSATEQNDELSAFVTIVIAARDEAHNINQLLTSLLQQDYSPTRFEIIIIDDHSTDETLALAKKYEDSQIHVFALADHLIPTTHQHAYKKAALELGIQNASGDIIMMTDADCTPEQSWIRDVVSGFNKGADMVLAPVQIHYSEGFLNAFQGLDVAGTMLLTGAAVSLGKPILANGANFAFRKSLFHDLNGYEGNQRRASGDDVFLLHKAVAATSHINYRTNRSAVVLTQSVDSWQALWKQRLRWAAKTTSYTNYWLLTFQAMVFGICACYVFMPLWLNWNQVLLLWGAKIMIDTCFLFYACQEVGDKQWWPWVLISSPLHTLYIVVIGIIALLPLHTDWKGRKIR